MDLGVSGTMVEEDCSKSRLSQGGHSKTTEFHSESRWLEGVLGLNVRTDHCHRVYWDTPHM